MARGGPAPDQGGGRTSSVRTRWWTSSTAALFRRSDPARSTRHSMPSRQGRSSSPLLGSPMPAAARPPVSVLSGSCRRGTLQRGGLHLCAACWRHGRAAPGATWSWLRCCACPAPARRRQAHSQAPLGRHAAVGQGPRARTTRRVKTWAATLSNSTADETGTSARPRTVTVRLCSNMSRSWPSEPSVSRHLVGGCASAAEALGVCSQPARHRPT